MKFFVVALSLVGICSPLAHDYSQNWKFASDCARELAMATNDVNKYMTEYNNFVDEPKAQNLVKCFFQKFGFIAANGEFQESVAIEMLATGDDRVLSEENVKQCTTTAGDNKANAFAIKLFSCYKEAPMEDSSANDEIVITPMRVKTATIELNRPAIELKRAVKMFIRYGFK